MSDWMNLHIHDEADRLQIRAYLSPELINWLNFKFQNRRWYAMSGPCSVTPDHHCITCKSMIVYGDGSTLKPGILYPEHIQMQTIIIPALHDFAHKLNTRHTDCGHVFVYALDIIKENGEIRVRSEMRK